MGATDLLSRLALAGVRLSVVGSDRLLAEPRAALTDELRALIRAHKPDLLAALGEIARRSCAIEPDLLETSGHWLILQAPQRTEMFFAPPISRGELMARYSGALLVPLPESVSKQPRPATAEETVELTRLVESVAKMEGFTESERIEAVTNALVDPDAARPCLRTLARESQTVAGRIAERSCLTCRHLRRPGTARGCASGREDLAPLFGPHHPLRRLPDDGGKACSLWGAR